LPPANTAAMFGCGGVALFYIGFSWHHCPPNV